ncbi:hypothetical protein ZWY2020_047830 [Hordeum vulgare]|nr:hypothetical protein ZWY2020_047830 [Hordeum vulgare]
MTIAVYRALEREVALCWSVSTEAACSAPLAKSCSSCRTGLAARTGGLPAQTDLGPPRSGRTAARQEAQTALKLRSALQFKGSGGILSEIELLLWSPVGRKEGRCSCDLLNLQSGFPCPTAHVHRLLQYRLLLRT